ncbi:hypothetical protein [Shimia ponticola]|uniref:hypothetical protein n=1 Tax=Shimia ponticola TaxID=2582893 RepID=UPI0011BF8FE3|nr:hypothetical protein [Shimia ponticola]
MDQNHTFDEEPELILDQDIRVSQAVDPHLASITLRPKTNNPTDGYNLGLSATFGKERLHLRVGREAIDFRIEIFQAEIKLDLANSTFDPLFEREQSVIQIGAHLHNLPESGNQRRARFNADTGELIEAVVGARVNLELETSSNRNEPDSWYEVSFLSDHVVKLRSCGAKPIALNGLLLDEFVGWNIIPRDDRDSGVLGRIRVREDWIQLSDPRPLGRTGKIWASVARLLSGGGREEEQRRKAFHILLTHLVGIGLQEASNTRDATLACDTVVVRHLSEEFRRAESEGVTPSINLNGTTLQRFLRSNPGSERALLRGAGVPEHRLSELNDSDDQGQSFGRDEIEEQIPELAFLEAYLSRINKKKLRSTFKRDEALDVLQLLVLEGFWSDNFRSSAKRTELREIGLINRPAAAKDLISKHSDQKDRMIKNRIGGQLTGFGDMLFIAFPKSSAMKIHKATAIEMVDEIISKTYD